MKAPDLVADANRTVVAVGVLSAGLAFCSVFAAERSLVALGLQLLAAEFMAGKMAVPWASAYRPVAGVRDVAEYMGRGFAIGAVAASVSGVAAKMGLGVDLDLGRLVGFGALLGALELLLAGARDEILLRGMIRRGFAGILSRPMVSVVAALAGCAWAFGLGEDHLEVLLREGALALVAVELWRLDDGAFSAIGFQAAFRFLEASFAGTKAVPSVLVAESVVLALTAVILWQKPDPADVVEARLGKLYYS